MKKLCIIGASGFAREVYSILIDLGWENQFHAFFQSDAFYKPSQIYEIDILPLSKFDSSQHKAVIAIADPKIRAKVAEELPKNTEFYSVIHPSAMISKLNVEIGEGAIICAGCIISCDLKIGKHAILNFATMIAHDCVIDDYFTTTSGILVNGRCIIGKRVYIGSNASLFGNNNICDDVIIGMGSVVLKNITEPGTYFGAPIKRII